MVSLLQIIGVNVLISLAVMVGYFIGIFTDEEIEKAANKAKIDVIFGYLFIIIEIATISLVLYGYKNEYFLAAGIIILINIVLSALYTALKKDLQKALAYSILSLICNLILSTIIILI